MTSYSGALIGRVEAEDSNRDYFGLEVDLSRNGFRMFVSDHQAQPDGRNTLYEWDGDELAVIATVEGEVGEETLGRSIALSGDGSRFAAGTWDDDDVVRVYEFVGVADAPTSVVATQGDLETTVSWDAPVHDGGEPISSYTITGSADDATCTWTSGPLECSITGLTIGDTYSFTVTANTANGNGLTSTSSNTITFAGVPDAPTNLTVEASDGEASLSWNQPDSNGSPITGYTATANPSGANCTTTNTTCTIDGLTNGTTYTFSVTASNAIGSSTASTEASATPGL